MLTDRYGLELSTSSELSRDAYVDATDRMLGTYANAEERLAEALEADPGFAVAHAAQARHHQLMARGAQARSAAERAVELAGGATAREQQHVEILKHLVSGAVPRSLELTREHLVDHPLDAFVLSPAASVFGTIGFSGRIGRESEMLSLLEPLAVHYGDDWWFQAAYAFALVETGQWERGRDLVQLSLDQRPDSPNAAHVLSHALYEGGADQESLEFMAGFLPESDPASPLHCHLWWHYSLLLMADGQTAAAWQAFSQNCMPGQTTSPPINVVTDASSYLWRSEVAGAPRNRGAWQSVRDYYEESFEAPIVFVDAHAGLAYAALGETESLEACITQLQELGEEGKLPAETTAASLTRGYEAYAREQWDSAIDALQPMIPQLVRIGGSRAQRDLVVNTLLSAYVKADRSAEAQAVLDGMHRHPTRPVAGLNNRHPA
ncbi:MAG: tetratricopeptide repeat protein [Acidimicrobiales bacterium]|nr:tetratricopeptide repeat protein [Acidimicrobiales bacterium]